jgi:hypothetical protein
MRFSKKKEIVALSLGGDHALIGFKRLRRRFDGKSKK